MTSNCTPAGFQFYEGAEQSQRLRVRFSGDFVAGLSAANGGSLPVARLEPVLIGGLYPAHNEDRILIKLDQVPPYLVETLVAVGGSGVLQSLRRIAQVHTHVPSGST